MILPILPVVASFLAFTLAQSHRSDAISRISVCADGIVACRQGCHCRSNAFGNTGCESSNDTLPEYACEVSVTEWCHGTVKPGFYELSSWSKHQGFCLNQGKCLIDEDGMSLCECFGLDYGLHCERQMPKRFLQSTSYPTLAGSSDVTTDAPMSNGMTAAPGKTDGPKTVTPTITKTSTTTQPSIVQPSSQPSISPRPAVVSSQPSVISSSTTSTPTTTPSSLQIEPTDSPTTNSGTLQPTQIFVAPQAPVLAPHSKPHHRTFYPTRQPRAWFPRPGSDSTGSSDLSPGAKAAVAIICIAAGLFICCCICRRGRRRQAYEQPHSDLEMAEFQDGSGTEGWQNNSPLTHQERDLL